MTGITDFKIGLALSGGGSRAIAFHLGCLRGLKRLGLLDKIVVLSTVSGGSVIGAYYQAHQNDFASFEAGIHSVLTQGLAKPMCKKLFSAIGLKVVVAAVTVGLVAIAVGAVRFLMKVIGFIAPTWIADKFEKVRNPLAPSPICEPDDAFGGRSRRLDVSRDKIEGLPGSAASCHQCHRAAHRVRLPVQHARIRLLALGRASPKRRGTRARGGRSRGLSALSPGV